MLTDTSELTEDEEFYVEERIAELLGLNESWDEISARREALDEIEKDRLEHLRHV